jgi:hypothetical protein
MNSFAYKSASDFVRRFGALCPFAAAMGGNVTPPFGRVLPAGKPGVSKPYGADISAGPSPFLDL